MPRVLTAGVAVLLVLMTFATASALWFGSSLRGLAPYLYVPVMLVAGGALGSSIARRTSARGASLVLLLLVSGYMLVSVIATEGPAKGPIGYANANAALAVQLAALAGVLGVHRPARPAAAGVIALAAATVLLNRSAGGLIVMALLLVTIALAWWTALPRRRWTIPAAWASLLTVVTVAQVLLARRTVWPQAALDVLDPTRQYLWVQAWAGFRQAEELGRGPGSYEVLNVIKDPDRSSAHSLPLQVAVELGVVGLVLLVAVYVSGVLVAMSGDSTKSGVVAVAGWSALAAHSFADHLIEYWPIPLTAGVVLGLAARPVTWLWTSDEHVGADDGARVADG